MRQLPSPLKPEFSANSYVHILRPEQHIAIAGRIVPSRVRRILEKNTLMQFANFLHHICLRSDPRIEMNRVSVKNLLLSRL
jgi:hypothetical protein